MFFPRREVVGRIRKEFPEGTRERLEDMNEWNEGYPVKVGVYACKV